MRCLLLLGLCGCELYFTDGARKTADAGAPAPPDAPVVCPSDPPPADLTGEILSPVDGATNVTSPVRVVFQWSHTNQDARKGSLFYDAATGSYTSWPVPCPDGNGFCHALQPNTQYTFRLFWVCYADGTQPLYDQITFTTAP